MSVPVTGAPGRAGAARYPRHSAGPRSLLVNELFLSIQGEGPEQGYPTVLARLTGCNLRCAYCDSAHAYFEGERASLPELVRRVSAFGVRRVLITGGEPMAQAATPALCRALIRNGHSVSMETNGSFDSPFCRAPS